MPVYYDPTEARKRSRLPQAIIQQGRELTGLEAITGADLLLSLRSFPGDALTELLKNSRTVKPAVGQVTHLAWRGMQPVAIAKALEVKLPFVLQVLKFRDTCQLGLLVQRKTGRDLASSVPRLSEILLKMLDWTDRPWLLFIGQLLCNRRGIAIIDKQNTGFSHAALQGALEKWQLRGGYVTFLSRDGRIAAWVSRQLANLRQGKRDDDKVIARKPRQRMINASSGRGWMTTLMTLRHIDATMAKRVADHYGNLAACIEALTDLDIPLMKDRPKGIGMTTVIDNRRWFGLTKPWMKFAVVGEPPEDMKGEREDE